MPVARKSRSLARKPSDPEDFRAPLSDHLDELRTRLMRSIFALTIGWVVGWFAAGWMNKLILGHILGAVKSGAPVGTSMQVAFTDATQAFMLLLRQSFMLGLVLALPFIVVQIWGFIAPGLKQSEREPIRKVLPLSIVLFFMGVYFCWLVLPATFSWFAGFLGSFPEAELNQNPENLVLFALKMMAAFGICFQLPLVVFGLGKAGVLSPDTLMQYWRQATVFIFFVAAAITPSQDPISMLMMALPLTILFIISVYAVKLTTRALPKPEEIVVFDDQE